MGKDMITMSTKELKRIHLVKKTEEKLITQKEAATMLHISERQFRRLVARFRNNGPSGLVHQSRDKPSHRKFEPRFCAEIATIYKNEFFGYKPTFFTEKLAEEKYISISKESVRKILINNNLWSPKRKKTNIAPCANVNTIQESWCKPMALSINGSLVLKDGAYLCSTLTMQHLVYSLDSTPTRVHYQLWILSAGI